MIEVWKDPNLRKAIPHVGWLEDEDCEGCEYYIKNPKPKYCSSCRAFEEGKECRMIERKEE